MPECTRGEEGKSKADVPEHPESEEEVSEVGTEEEKSLAEVEEAKE